MRNTFGHLVRTTRGAGRSIQDERGQAYLMTLLLFAVMFLLASFGISVAGFVAAQVSAQRAADAAALAGCMDLPNVSLAQTDAVKYGASSGGLNATTNQNLESGNGNQSVPFPPSTVTAGPTPAAGGTPIPNGKIDVVVQRTQRALLFNNNQTIQAAAACKRKEGGLAVVVVLDPSASNTLALQGGFNLNLGSPSASDSGGIVVNSSSATGLSLNGGASITAKYTDVGNASAQYSLCGSCSITATPTTGTLADPFRNVAEPAVPAPPSPLPPGCSGTAASPANCGIADSSTLNPGTYYGGLTLGVGTGTNCNAATPPTVTLNPGTYYLAGGSNQGGLTVCAGTTVKCAGGCSSTGGVMFFNGLDSSATQMSKRPCGPITIQNSAQLLLVPPQSGTYDRLLFFQSRSCAGDPAGTAKINSGVTIGLNPTGGGAAGACGGFHCGVFYVPGCPGGTLNSVLCAPTINVTVDLGPQGGGQVFNVNCTLPSGTTVSTPDCINVAVIADKVQITGQITFNNPFIPSGSVNHGDVTLVPYP